jgi:geranylgeranyl pyrophosphate synthase
MTSKDTVHSTTEAMTTGKVTPGGLASVQDAMQLIEQLLFDVVDSDVEVLRDASRHILKAGGKRIRPRLMLLSYMATGGTDTRKIIPPAAAIELVHTASVVHDDINDHGIIRRGRPSVNAVWGRTFALLTGDYLFTKVYELMAPYRDLNVLFAEATIALVEGETLQAAAVKDDNFSQEIYHEIIARKTAALFRVGAILGAKLSDATEEEAEALGQFGYNIGLAFQIVDDILDLVGDEAELGKTAGIDLAQGKGFASIHDNGRENEGILDSIKERVNDGNTIDAAQEQARLLVQAAIGTLSILPDSPHRESLINLAQSVVDRRF